jgi:hypothetical protein
LREKYDFVIELENDEKIVCWFNDLGKIWEKILIEIF